jgi:energy-coupling factor transporter ATP-binding protein EcfA2
LDSEGKARVVEVLKDLQQGTILLVSQTHGDVADAFDLVDVVVKQNDTARIESITTLN